MGFLTSRLDNETFEKYYDKQTCNLDSVTSVDREEVFDSMQFLAICNRTMLLGINK